MYQSIDDDIDKTDAHMQSVNSLRAKLIDYRIWIFASLAIFVILLIISLSQADRSQNQPSEQAQNIEAYLTYRKALGETDIAMRRARLKDFIRVHPTHSRFEAAQLQVSIINLRDNQDWNELTDLVYNPRIKRATKLKAIDSYNEKWRGSLLGGRNEEITRLKTETLGMADKSPLPNRRLDTSASSIPQNIKDDSFLGAPHREVVTIEQPRPQAPQSVAITPKDSAKIVMPRVRRNATPKYPRKAYKRNIDAVVTLKLNIDAKGKVKMTELVSVEAKRYEKSFIRAAERAAMRTRYHPKTIDGKAVPTSGFIRRYRFSSNR